MEVLDNTRVGGTATYGVFGIADNPSDRPVDMRAGWEAAIVRPTLASMWIH